MLGPIIGAVALFVVGFGGGWTVNGRQHRPEMRMSSHRMKRLNRAMRSLVAANDRCATDIDGIR